VVIVVAIVFAGSLIAGIVRDGGGGDGPRSADVPPASVPTQTPTIPPTGITPPAVGDASATPPVATPVDGGETANTLGEPYVVCLDVGHGGMDWGFTRVDDDEIIAVEKDIVLDISERIEERLEAQGIEVVLTRTEDQLVNVSGDDVNGDGEQATDGDGDGLIDTPNVDEPNNLDELQARVNVCNEAQADLLISVHINGAENTALQGYEAWWANGRPFSDQSQWFAEEIVSQFGTQFEDAGFTEIESRGAQADSETDIPEQDLPQDAFVHYVVLSPDVEGRNFTGSTMPGAVVESLFMSSDTDWEVLGTEEGIEAIVQAYVVSINGFFTEFPVEGKRLSTGEPESLPVPSDEPSAEAAGTVADATAETSLSPEATPIPYEQALLPPPAETDEESSFVVETYDTDRMEVALTFDCGADRGFTEELLDLLDSYGIKGSFGMTGLWAEENPDLVQRMARDGHMIFNHSYSHGSFTGRSTDSTDPGSAYRIEELERTEQVIQEITGGYTMRPYWRPPYGDIGPQTLRDAATAGYGVTVLWTVDTFGWNGFTGEQVAERSLDTLQPGQIILMHVGFGAQGDFDSLPTIIETSMAEGYRFVTVAEMMQPDAVEVPEATPDAGSAMNPDAPAVSNAVVEETAIRDESRSAMRRLAGRVAA
jgi:peptidoglycan/xylan/chitin deacetylase (PgdA/CDA1 family)/N-acetylmuramoyl-L-alanine amidase